jgi:hypothetical protein
VTTVTSHTVVLDPDPVKPKRIVLDRTFRQWLGDISYHTQLRLEQTDPEFPAKVRISPGLTGRDADAAIAYIEKKISVAHAAALMPQPPRSPEAPLTCRDCGAEFRYSGRGRPAKSCDACRAASN